MPPASRKTPEAGVTHPLHWRTAITRFNAPVNVAATNNGATYLRHNLVSHSLIASEFVRGNSMFCSHTNLNWLTNWPEVEGIADGERVPML